MLCQKISCRRGTRSRRNTPKYGCTCRIVTITAVHIFARLNHYAVCFNHDSPRLRESAREAHSEYLLRFLCFQLGIVQHHAVQSYDLAPNLISNEGNDVYARLNSEAGARGLYNDNPLLAAAVRTHLARPSSSHILFGERVKMLGSIVFSTLNVPQRHCRSPRAIAYQVIVCDLACDGGDSMRDRCVMSELLLS